MSGDGSRWVDPDRLACLCKQGLPGFIAAVAVEPDGEETLWLFCEDLLGERVDHGNPFPRHELVGRLPRDVRESIWSLRCGQPTASGSPCRHKVSEPGQMCSQHSGGRRYAPPKRVWPRAECLHCGKNVAVGPICGRFVGHNCKEPCCRPGDLTEYVRRWREGSLGYGHLSDAEVEARLIGEGFPCPMSGEIAEGAS